MSMPEKMSLSSMDVAEAKRKRLKELFPEVFSDGKIDFDQLKRVLGEWVDPGKERFGLNWAGKAECMKALQQPSMATLKPQEDKSINFDGAENIFVEGDNFEVMKILQKSYFEKVKFIYIDPPYNTGGEFIYPDKYSDTIGEYLNYTDQTSESGKKIATNTDASGRYHTRWLNMIYPRIYLANNFLTEDGVIFIAIDDNEVNNLRGVCDDIFGEENFIAQLVWEKTRKNDAKLFSVGHDYMLVYAKSLTCLKEKKTIWRESKPGAKEIFEQYKMLRKRLGNNDQAVQDELREWYAGLPVTHPSKKLSRYKWVDKFGPWRDRDISWPGGGGPTYPVIHPGTKRPCAVPEAGWRFSTPESMQRQIDLDLIVFREDHRQPPFRKAHLIPIPEEIDEEAANVEEDIDQNSEQEDEDAVGLQVMPSIIYKQSQVAVKYLKKLIGGKLFDNPKDHEIISRLIRYCTSDDRNCIVMDFFAGSGSTAEAVMHANNADGGNRKFIMVQLPEPCQAKTPAHKAGFATIADLCLKRIKLAVEKATHGSSDAPSLFAPTAKDNTFGIRVFKLDRSNFKPWSGEVGDVEQIEKQLTLHIEHISRESSQYDVLFEILINDGFVLDAKIMKINILNKEVFSIADGSMIICLEREITPELIDALAEAAPLRVICLDEAFKGNDQLKANAVQTFKARAASQESAIVFKTV